MLHNSKATCFLETCFIGKCEELARMYIISFLLKVSKNYDPLNQIGNSKISKTRVPVNKVRYLETRSAEIRGGGWGSQKLEISSELTF